jgi:hypothetical protein
MAASPAWVVSDTLAGHIDGAHRALLRVAINVHWLEVISNDALYTRTGASPASATMRLKRLTLLGKAIRAEPRQLPLSRVLKHQPIERYRRRGRPQKTMWSVLEDDLSRLGLTLPQAWQVAVNAKNWRQRLNAI